MTEAIKKQIEDSDLIGFEFYQLEDDRDPLFMSAKPFIFEDQQFGIKLEIPDGWDISTASKYGVTPNKLRSHSKKTKESVCSPNDRLLLDMSFYRLDCPARRYGGIDLWVCKNTTTENIDDMIQQKLQKYKKQNKCEIHGTMQIANKKFMYMDHELDSKAYDGVIRYALAPLDKEHFISIMLRGYTPRLFQAILKIIDKLMIE